MDARKKELEKLLKEINSMEKSTVLANLCSSSIDELILFERFQYLYYRQKRIVLILEELCKEVGVREKESDETAILTAKKLKEMKPYTIFARGKGVIPEFHRTVPVKWIAIRGGIEDWVIYYHKVEMSDEYVKSHGDKCFTADTIRKLVPCNEEAFKLYRL